MLLDGGDKTGNIVLLRLDIHPQPMLSHGLGRDGTNGRSLQAFR